MVQSCEYEKTFIVGYFNLIKSVLSIGETIVYSLFWSALAEIFEKPL